MHSGLSNGNMYSSDNLYENEFSKMESNLSKKVEVAVQNQFDTMLENMKSKARSEKKGKSNEGEA